MKSILYRYNPWWERGYVFPEIIERKAWTDIINSQVNQPVITFLTGLRRIGKTTLMKLTIKELIENRGLTSNCILYFPADDYLLSSNSLLEIVDEFRKIHQHKFTQKLYLFFDEITYKEDYEIQLKNLIDNHNVKIIASSSSASLLASKKPFLTGRQHIVEVLPLNYQEYLIFKNISVLPTDEHLHGIYFHDFLTTGGIPEYVKTGKIEYINNLVDDIIYKDIAAVHGIKNIQLLKDYFLLLMERAGKQVSINKTASILSVSVDTARRYFEHFQSTFLIHTVLRFGTTNEKLLSPKKIFAADTGISNFFTGNREYGALFENYVYLRIKLFLPNYLYTNQTEIDFVFKQHKVLAEAKYHKEGLSKKQQELFDKEKKYSTYIITCENDIEQLLKLLKSNLDLSQKN